MTSNKFNQIKDALQNKRIFLTGGTGFFGKSILDYVVKNEIELDLTVLSRDPTGFSEEHPGLIKDISFVEGDVTNYSYDGHDYDYVIHAATTVSGVNDKENANAVIECVINGTKNILQFSQDAGAKKLLNISSGAVYGNQPSDITHITEDYMGGPDTSKLTSVYGEAKRISELLCTLFCDEAALEYVNARCFAFIGPYLPLDGHFAIGNFINDGLNGRDLIIKGNGTPIRSYMYADDLVIWLLTLLVKGKNGESYNVGSDVGYSIKEIAEVVNLHFPQSKIVVSENVPVDSLYKARERYLPSIEKCKEMFGLGVDYGLEEAIEQTVLSYK